MRAVYIEDGEVRLAPVVECTGVAARWCPIHGDCTDDLNAHRADAETRPYSDHCSDEECPLHGRISTHAEVGR